MVNNSYILTIDFGYVPVRRTHIEGTWLQNIELCEGFAEVRKDDRTQQPFAVLYDDNWNLIK